jgi:hypothetical protein
MGIPWVEEVKPGLVTEPELLDTVAGLWCPLREFAEVTEVTSVHWLGLPVLGAEAAGVGFKVLTGSVDWWADWMLPGVVMELVVVWPPEMVISLILSC